MAISRIGDFSLSDQELAQSERFQKLSANEMYCAPLQMRVVTHDRGGFASLSNHNILVYLPHGFGDWVHFSHILPYLDHSNRYWFTRFADDSVSLMDGSPYCEPVYLGIKSTSCRNGEELGNQHFGIDYGSITGDVMDVSLPAALYEVVIRNRIDTILFTDFPEVWGTTAYPFHTKARNMLRYLVPENRLNERTLSQPLMTAINLSVDRWVTQIVEAYLRSQLCLIGRNGYTGVSKNWGHEWREQDDGSRLPEGEEARDFMRLMLKKDPRWCFLSIEDQHFEGEDTLISDELRCYSYARIFGNMETAILPFGLAMKALVNLADLSIGIPSGPHHLSMLRADLPSVGIWIAHYPSWYDEPKEASIHVLSRNIRDSSYYDHDGTFTEHGALRYRVIELDTKRVLGQDVMNAVETLL
jgi:hypothetical protein